MSDRRSETGATKLGEPWVALHDGDTPVLKAYFSPDGLQVRVVMPEYVKIGQIKQHEDQHFIVFTRKPKPRGARR